MPKNITTNPPKEGHYNTTNDHTFMPKEKWMKEPYERPRFLEKEKNKKIRTKMAKIHEKPFYRPNGGKGGTFSNNQKTFALSKSVKIPVIFLTFLISRKIRGG